MVCASRRILQLLLAPLSRNPLIPSLPQAALESGGVVMSTPLPGVYDDTASVAASAVVGASEPVGGVGFRLESSNAVGACFKEGADS